MKLLWLFVFLPAVLGEPEFGRSYLSNSRLCHKWFCINQKLGFPESSLPPRQQTEETLRRLLPAGPWQDVVDKVLDTCYGIRPRRYMNTCSGQALLHCVVDQMIENCPDGSWRRDDACSPISTLAGQKYMFSQSRYENLEMNLPKEHRPAWFLKNYFDSKCCDLPVMFNMTVLEECGISTFINYYTNGPKHTDDQIVGSKKDASSPTTTPDNGNKLKIVDLSPITSNDDTSDPLDCCDMTKFVQPSWRSECDFHLSWGGTERLVISNQSHVTTEAPTTTTESAEEIKDLMLVPHSCEKETCVFRKLGIINENGVLDIDAYLRMLQNFTNAHPAWTKAKARVVTKCIVNPVERSYEAGCLINKLLSCTFDVLTEVYVYVLGHRSTIDANKVSKPMLFRIIDPNNSTKFSLRSCPYKSKYSDKCKHGKFDFGCQISSSKYRPKNRREICLLPELIPRERLTECGIESLYRAEHIPVPKPRKHGWYASKFMCKDNTGPTTCIMKKMGVLNRYNFMDYFNMKNRIRQFTADQTEWAALLDIYMSAFINIPMYSEHCSSQKKLLNVLDAMLMTCPMSKRKNTTQCNKIFNDMINNAPMDKSNVTREKLDEIMKHYHHVFMPAQSPITKLNRVFRKKYSQTVRKPIYEFGLLNSKNAPPVNIISVKPETTSRRPLVLLPVYLRPGYGQPRRPYFDGVFRNDPFWLHDQIARAHTTPISEVHTIPTVHNNVYTTRPLIPTMVPTFSQPIVDLPIEMLKPE